MSPATTPRATFIDRVLTSSFAGQVARRFLFADGEVAALYTLSRKAMPGVAQPVVLFVATFPPQLTQDGVHDFGIDYIEQPVASTQEAQDLLRQFDHEQAVRFRTSCRPQRA